MIIYTYFIFLASCKVSGMDAASYTTCVCEDGTYFEDTGDTCATCDNVRCKTCESAG